MNAGRPRTDATEFSNRLNALLDNYPGCPPLERGRAPWLAKRYKVSQPTARGWVKGLNLPTRERILDIANDFGTTYDHLVFGEANKGLTTVIETRPEGPQSHAVRDTDLRLAVRLAYEALGPELHLTPAQHTELVMLLLDLIREDMPEARMLQFARRTATALNRGADDDERGKDHANPSAARKRK